MARMCEMTLACATILVAGTVASASDKLTANQDGVVLNNGPTNIFEAMAAKQARGGAGIAFNQTTLVPDPQDDCECPDADDENVWENGNYDGSAPGNGQVSHEGGSINQGAKVADDFCLCDGQIYKLREISGVMLTDSLLKIRRARLEVYSDCNGCPDQLLFTLKKHEAPLAFASVGDGFFALEYRFVIANQPAPAVGEEDLRQITLKGGCYWVSLVGLTDGQGTDSSFWGVSSDENIKGSVAKKIDGLGNGGWGTNFSYPPNRNSSGVCSWQPLDECCIGCVDMAFQVCADVCKILKDNGPCNNSGSISEKSLSTRNSRSADDFVVRNCIDFDLCYIEGCILTNCTDFRAFAEIYENDCKLPTPNPAKLTNTAFRGPFYATKLVRLSLTATIEGRTLQGYRAEFCLDDVAAGDRLLGGGGNYWLSIGVEDTFSFNERAYFCHNRADACANNNCPIMFNPAAWYSPSRGIENWTSLGNVDLCFLVAGVELDDDNPYPATNTCVADFDLSGTVDADDIFAFLNAWFAGCP